MKIKNDKKLKKRITQRKIIVYLLGLFFLIAVIMTNLSQKNYQNHLTEVNVVQPIKKKLLHTREYMADYQKTEDGIVIQWEMEEFGELAKDGEVWIYPITLQNQVTEKGNLVPFYIKGTAYPGLWIQIAQKLESGTYQMETSLKDVPSELIEADFLMAVVTFYGQEQKSVIPYSAVIPPATPTESYRLYIVEEIPKIWGTALQTKAVPILILESNGTEVAIGNTILSAIVTDIKQSGIHEGMSIKIFENTFYPEEEENYEEKKK